MFKPLIQFVLQHLMQQNSWTAPLLQPYANQTIRMDFKVAQVTLTILQNGELAVAADSADPDATIHLPPSLVMRLLRKDPLASSMIKIDGNATLGIEVGKIFSAIRWDVEEDLSKVVGDVAAYQVVQLGQEKFKQLQTNAKNLGEMLVEYWQEEQPLMAKKTSVENFNQSVDRLREDADRLQSRIEKLLAAAPSPESR
ncbi:MAG: SCP2 domain-containing protein [Methylophilus sp.]|uniref:ubiquinone biosynthesis accessory factor UbiJ n=1 Tax=Methylophilus sp. TaxID=29541 RepID=UPI002B598E2F|nr:SCP2 sterol-binding domain-containing protein [Methylophilus sp.]HSH85792.1 SCP2 sterol-binding domain-containing protein [Methylophilus sp.]